MAINRLLFFAVIEPEADEQPIQRALPHFNDSAVGNAVDWCPVRRANIYTVVKGFSAADWVGSCAKRGRNVKFLLHGGAEALAQKVTAFRLVKLVFRIIKISSISNDQPVKK